LEDPRLPDPRKKKKKKTLTHTPQKNCAIVRVMFRDVNRV